LLVKSVGKYKRQELLHTSTSMLWTVFVVSDADLWSPISQWNSISWKVAVDPPPLVVCRSAPRSRAFASLSQVSSKFSRQLPSPK